MSEERFSNREIDLKFEVIKTLLEQIASDLKSSNLNTEKRFAQIEAELSAIRADVDAELSGVRDHVDMKLSTIYVDVDDLKTFKTKALVYWGIFITALSIIINKFL